MNVPNFSQRRFSILLVEDGEDDVLLTKHVFKTLPIDVDFHVARHGLEALNYLRQKPPRADAPLPDMILLDLNMPRMDGWQLLAELKHDEFLRPIPIVILTTSDNEVDVRKAYCNHASAYMTKPIDVQEFSRRMRCFADFWLSGAAVLPAPLSLVSSPM
jgi:CheY-like chemotaxis protein